MKNILLIITLSFLSLNIRAAEMPYKLDHRIPLPGGEGWDYPSIDLGSSRLFVTRGNHVDVVDLKTEKVVGTLRESLDGVHGVAFADEFGKGYISSGKNSKVIVFDLSSLKVLKEIPAGKKPDSIVYNESQHLVISFNGGDSSATVIDAKTDQVVKTIKLEGKPEFAVSLGDFVYVPNEDAGKMIQIDTKKLEVAHNWPLKNCKSPTGLAVNSVQKVLFTTCANEIMEILSAETGNFLGTLKIDKGSDGAGFDNGFAFSSNGAGTLTLGRLGDDRKYTVVASVPTQNGARTMVVDPKTHFVYLIAAKYAELDPKAPPGTRPAILPGGVEVLVVR